MRKGTPINSFFICVFVCVCGHVCVVYACMYMHSLGVFTSVKTYAEAWDCRQDDFFMTLSLVYVFGWVFSLNLKFVPLERLAGWGALGIHQSLLSSAGVRDNETAFGFYVSDPYLIWAPHAWAIGELWQSIILINLEFSLLFSPWLETIIFLSCLIVINNNPPSTILSKIGVVSPPSCCYQS